MHTFSICVLPITSFRPRNQFHFTQKQPGARPASKTRNYTQAFKIAISLTTQHPATKEKSCESPVFERIILRPYNANYGVSIVNGSQQYFMKFQLTRFRNEKNVAGFWPQHPEFNKEFGRFFYCERNRMLHWTYFVKNSNYK